MNTWGLRTLVQSKHALLGGGESMLKDCWMEACFNLRMRKACLRCLRGSMLCAYASGCQQFTTQHKETNGIIVLGLGSLELSACKGS